MLHAKVGTIAPINGNQLLASLENEIGILQLSNGEYTKYKELEDKLDQNRFNDGKCDPFGRFWFGSMHLPETSPTAHLYCLHRDGRIRHHLSDITVSNGLTWDVSKKQFYYIDSPTRTICAFDFDDSFSPISHKRTIIQVPERLGFPDGMTIDKDGLLYVALWGGYGVGIWNPTTGKLEDKIEVAAPNVTSCAFGGADHTELYISTARKGLSDELLLQYPLSGSLFYAKDIAKGSPAFSFLPENNFPSPKI
ncbi:SMP-30/gluconolactonase/LRE family protein [Echinicola sediminis]